MDLSSRYLGMELPHPFVPGASPLADDLDAVRRLEDAGAAAIVMRSLFEEQIEAEQRAIVAHVELPAESFAEATSYLPDPGSFRLGVDEYLEHLRRIRDAVGIPVIGSLNGTTEGPWLDSARAIERAGASALELNLYHLETDPTTDARHFEERLRDLVAHVAVELEIPVAVKLSPFFSSLAHFACQLEEAGAGGLVIFNRFYQADLDIEELEVERRLALSDSSELLLRLRWLAVLSAQRELSLGVTGGVHTVEDAIKALMCGADVVQLVSALLLHGAARLTMLRDGLAAWLEEHDYESLAQLRGSMNLARCPDPAAYERANYMQILQSWKLRV